LGRVELVVSNLIHRHLEAILDEGNPPADEYDRPQWRGLVFEMPNQAIGMKMLETVSSKIVCMESSPPKAYGKIKGSYTMV
jgi:hypothetical protein